MTGKGDTPVPRAAHKLTLVIGGLTRLNVGLGKPCDAVNTVSAKYVCPEHRTPVGQRWYCEEGDHVLDKGDGVGDGRYAPARGYPYGEGADTQYVILDDDSLEKIRIEREQMVEIRGSAHWDEIDPLWIDKSYIAWPQSGRSDGPLYDTFGAVMAERELALYGQACLNKRTQMIAFRWSKQFNLITAHTCHFWAQMRWPQISLVDTAAANRPAPEGNTLKLAEQIVATIDSGFANEALEDTYTAALREEIDRVATGGLITPAKPPVTAADVPDLQRALRDTLAQVKKTKGRAKAPPKKTTAKRRTK